LHIIHFCAVLQGMSDLLSPILFVMGDESESFWCFVSLMERLGPNFNRDQNGMHSQLFAISKVSLSLSLSLSHTHTHTHTQSVDESCCTSRNARIMLHAQNLHLYFPHVF
jgi:hypothetical protein